MVIWLLKLYGDEFELRGWVVVNMESFETTLTKEVGRL